MLSTSDLKNLLNDWQSGQASLQEVLSGFRTYHLNSRLPEKFGKALENVLGRLESASLFTEESCSFSQKDLIDALSIWLDKAQTHLSSGSLNS